MIPIRTVMIPSIMKILEDVSHAQLSILEVRQNSPSPSSVVSKTSHLHETIGQNS